MATRIKEKYLAEAIPALEEKFGYKNAMQVPKLAKIVATRTPCRFRSSPRS